MKAELSFLQSVADFQMLKHERREEAACPGTSSGKAQVYQGWFSDDTTWHSL